MSSVALALIYKIYFFMASSCFLETSYFRNISSYFLEEDCYFLEAYSFILATYFSILEVYFFYRWS